MISFILSQNNHLLRISPLWQDLHHALWPKSNSWYRQDTNHSRKSRNATKMAFLTKKSILPKLMVSKNCVHVIQKFYDLLLFKGCYYLNHKISFNLSVQVAIILVFHEPFMMLFHILRSVLDHEWKSDNFLNPSSVEANGVTNKEKELHKMRPVTKRDFLRKSEICSKFKPPLKKLVEDIFWNYTNL